ncbi:2-phosphosulfolactate phosphatase [Bacillus sp. FSL W7-1360]
MLSFSSTVVAALHNGAVIYPYPLHEDGKMYAQSIGATYLPGRSEAAKLGVPTLSPVSFAREHCERRFVLSSLNGAHCAWIAKQVPKLVIGSLLNAAAVASYCNKLQEEINRPITVVSCGERWDDARAEENNMRPAIEDALGAGAILQGLAGSKSPEAQVCIASFGGCRNELSELVTSCGSGQELIARGYEDDVAFCAQFNATTVVPVLNPNGTYFENGLRDN